MVSTSKAASLTEPSLHFPGSFNIVLFTTKNGSSPVLRSSRGERQGRLSMRRKSSCHSADLVTTPFPVPYKILVGVIRFTRFCVQDLKGLKNSQRPLCASIYSVRICSKGNERRQVRPPHRNVSLANMGENGGTYMPVMRQR